jgi:hypothetical protein
MQKQISRTLTILLARFDGQILIPLVPAAEAVGISQQTARNQLTAGKFPLPTLQIGRRRFIHVEDLAKFVDSLRGESQPKRGARSKKERIEAQEAQAGRAA